MITSDNAPTLCPRCVHFTKNYGVPGCAAAPWSDVGYKALDIRHWLKRQTEERSWEWMGACPGFEHNGTVPIDAPDARRFTKFLAKLKEA